MSARLERRRRAARRGRDEQRGLRAKRSELREPQAPLDVPRYEERFQEFVRARWTRWFTAAFSATGWTRSQMARKIGGPVRADLVSEWLSGAHSITERSA